MFLDDVKQKSSARMSKRSREQLQLFSKQCRCLEKLQDRFEEGQDLITWRNYAVGLRQFVV